jgi:hypothetical protein
MSAPYPPESQPRHEPWHDPRTANRPQPPEPSLPREEIAATIEARRELGPQYERALVERLAHEVDMVISAQAERRVAYLKQERRGSKEALALAIVSLGTGIPITAIAASLAEGPGMVVAWLGIVGVNAAHAWANRRRK